MKCLLMFLILLSIGCRQKTGDKKANSANVKEISVGDMSVIAKFMDHDYSTDEAFKKDTQNSALISKREFLYFNVKLEKKSVTKFDKDKVLYLNFDMQNDFTLVNKQDSILPSFCQKIENGIHDSYEYMIAFENDKQNQKYKPDYTLIYNDKIFGIGTVAFTYGQ